MKNIKALLKLEIQLLAPYWKWFLLFFGISLLIGFSSRAGIAFMISAAIFASTIMAFPHESMEKSNLGILYAVLPTNRKSMIAARFLFKIIFMAVVLALSLGISLLIDAIFDTAPPITVSFTFLGLAVGVGIYLLFTGIATPFFYKYGYIKGRIFMWIPIVLINIVLLLPLILGPLNIEFNPINLLFNNALAASLISLGVGVFTLVGSYFLTRKLYLSRDL